MRIGILAPPGVQSLDVVGPCEVFWEASRRLQQPSAYHIQIISTDSPVINGTGRIRMLADATIEDELEPFDTLLVAGDPAFREIDPKIIDWLARTVPQCRRYGSICTGVFLLAKAGLLSGKTVTTHWECAERFSQQYPEIPLDTDAIFIKDGQLITAAGVTSGIDLALAMVEDDYGHEVAMAVARYMVVFLKRPGGQSQFSAHLIGQNSDKAAVRQAQDFILGNLEKNISVERVAAEVNMSTRNFSRTFKKDIGVTPAAFIASARADAARRLLEDPSIPLQKVAQRSGFNDTAHMRRVFSRTLGISPTEYRSRFYD